MDSANRPTSAATAQQKSFLDKDTPPEEMIRGLLDCMPMGAKTVTILPAEAVQALADGGETRGK